MNKDKFVKWCETKIEVLKNKTPEKLENNELSKAYLSGGIKALEEIKEMVNEGKFE